MGFELAKIKFDQNGEGCREVLGIGKYSINI